MVWWNDEHAIRRKVEQEVGQRLSDDFWVAIWRDFGWEASDESSAENGCDIWSKRCRSISWRAWRPNSASRLVVLPGGGVARLPAAGSRLIGISGSLRLTSSAPYGISHMSVRYARRRRCWVAGG